MTVTTAKAIRSIGSAYGPEVELAALRLLFEVLSSPVEHDIRSMADRHEVSKNNMLAVVRALLDCGWITIESGLVHAGSDFISLIRSIAPTRPKRKKKKKRVVKKKRPETPEEKFERQKKWLIEKIRPYESKYPYEMRRAFVEYWCEQGISDGRSRLDDVDKFHEGRRLATWARKARENPNWQ